MRLIRRGLCIGGGIFGRILWVGLLAMLILGHSVFAEESRYIQATRDKTLIYTQADAQSEAAYFTFKTFVFKEIGHTKFFHQVALLSGEEGWIAREDAEPYVGPVPPPLSRYAFVMPMPKQPVPIEQSVSASGNLAENATENAVESETSEWPILSSTDAVYAVSGPSIPESILQSRLTQAIPSESVPETVNPHVNRPYVDPWENEYYRLPDVNAFRYPYKPEGRYPDISMDGYTEYKIIKKEFSPRSPFDKRFEVIQNDPIYKKLPRDALVGDVRNELSLEFAIDGKLAEDLTVHYDIEVLPDLPKKYDIYVDYKNTHLKFWHYDVAFDNGEFVQLTRALDGAKLVQTEDNWSAQIAMGRQRSDPQVKIIQGNGSAKYGLGQPNILKDSLKIWVQNDLKSEGSDYTVNYFQGEVTFHRNIQKGEQIKAIYEFTNPVADFIPVLSRKNFLGVEAKYQQREKPRSVFITQHRKDVVLWPNTNEDAAKTANGVTIFSLPDRYIVLGSSTILLNNIPLQPLKDYYIRIEEGRVDLINLPLTPSDSVSISYDYYETEVAYESIVGQNSPGPYALSHTDIVSDTLSLSVNGDFLKEGLDYTIEPKDGTITFTVRVLYPSIISAGYRYKKTSIIQPEKDDNRFNVGFTYLNESVKEDSESLERDVPSENFTLTLVNGVYSFFTKNTSIISKDAVSISVGGETVDPSLYTVNLYSGQVTFDPLFDPKGVQTGTVTYRYTRGVDATYVFYGNGKSGRNNPYQNNVDPEFNLTDVPVRYKGVNFIVLTTGSGLVYRLQEGQDFLVNYKESDPDEAGIFIDIAFVTDDDGSFGSNINGLSIDQSTRIELHYDYVKDNADEGNIDQKVFAVTLGAKVTDKWRVSTEIAGAQNNFSRPVSNGDFGVASPVFGNNTANQSFSLGKQNIQENSETVYVVDTTQAVDTLIQLNRDEHYFINYKTGILRLKNTPLPTTTRIEASFKYFDPNSAEASTGELNEIRYAKKFTSDYVGDSITLSTSFTQIDKDYESLAPIQESAGSDIFENKFKWTLDESEYIEVDYSRRKTHAGTVVEDSLKDVFHYEDDLKTRAALNLFDRVDTTQELYYYFELQDPSSLENKLYDKDRRRLDYKSTYSVGPDFFRNSVFFNRTQEISDVVDEKRKAVTDIRSIGYQSKFNKPKLPFLGKVMLAPRFSDDQTITNVDDTVALEKATSIEKRTKMGIDSSFDPTSKLSFGANFSVEDVFNETEKVKTATDNVISSSNTVQQIRNTYYFTRYEPFSWFKVNANHSLNQNESFLSGISGSSDQTTRLNLGHFSPYGLLQDLGVPSEQFLIRPFKKTVLAANVYDTASSKSDNLIKTDRHSLTYRMTHVEPLPGFVLTQLSHTDSVYSNRNFVANTSVSSNVSFTTSQDDSIAFDVQPQYPILNWFKYTFSERDSATQTLVNQNAVSVTRSVITDSTPEYNRNQSLSLSPKRIPYLGVFSASVSERIDDRRNRKQTDYFSVGSSDVSSSNTVLDNRNITELQYNAGYSPFRVLNLDMTLRDKNEQYNRNKLNNTGSSFTEEYARDFNGTYRPLSFLSFNSKYSTLDLAQHSAPNIDVTLSEIKSHLGEPGDFFSRFIRRHSESLTGTVSLKPSRYFELTTGMEQSLVEDHVVTSNRSVISSLQTNGIAGLKIWPFSWATVRYDYHFTLKNQFNGVEVGNAYKTILDVDIRLYERKIRQRTVEVKFNYNRVHTWGVILNTIEQETARQQNGDILATNVRSGDAYVEKGSLIVDVDIPLLKYPYVKNLVISGEGYIKKVVDDNDRFLSNPETELFSSYDISGMVIKGTLNF